MANLNLTDTGIHSSSKSTTKQILTATPQFNMVNPYEFTMSNQPVAFTSFGGTASSPTMVGTTSGLINVGDILKMNVSGTTKDFQVGGVSSVTGTVVTLDSSAGGHSSSGTLTNSNMTWSSNSLGSWQSVRAATSKSAGKWYCEVLVGSIDSSNCVGIVNSSFNPSTAGTWIFSGASGWAYDYNGTKATNGSYLSYGTAFAANDIIGIALDLDNGYLYFSRNGVWQNSGVPTSGASGTGAAYGSLSGSFYFAASTANTTGLTFNLGASSWSYTCPTGFSGISFSGTTYTLSNLKDSTGTTPLAVPTSVYKEKTVSNFNVSQIGSYATLDTSASGHNALGTISNNNLTWNNNGTYHRTARSSVSKSTGKWYCEVNLDVIGGSCNHGIALSTCDVTASGFPGNLSNSYGYDYPLGGMVVNDKIQIAFDADMGKMWIGRNGVWVGSGDPAAGSNPISTFTPGSTVYFAHSEYNGQSTINYGATSFAYTKPTGFNVMTSGSTASAWELTNASGGALSTGDSIVADGVSQTPSTIVQTGTGPTQISQATGTIVTNFTYRSSSAFDGTDIQVASASMASNDSPYVTSGYIGKNWGSNNIISKVVLISPSDYIFYAYNNVPFTSITFTLYGKNGSPSNATDGNQLGSTTLNYANISLGQTATIIPSDYTGYSCHWVNVVVTGSTGNAYLCIAEVKFYTSGYTYNCTLSTPTSIPTVVSKVIPTTSLTATNSTSGLLSAGDELYFKNVGSNTLVPVQVGGVSATGGLTNITDTTTTITTSTNYWLYVNTSLKITNGISVTKIGIYNTIVNPNMVLKIVRYDGGASCTCVALKSMSHNGTGWEYATLDTPYSVPASGNYYIGVYSANIYSAGSASRIYGSDIGLNETNGSMYTDSPLTTCKTGYYYGTTASYTLSNIKSVPSLYSLPEKAYKIRNSKYTFDVFLGTSTYTTWDSSASGHRSTGILSNGNLTWVSNGGHATARSSIYKTSGKWYCEININTVGGSVNPGVALSTADMNQAGTGSYPGGPNLTNSYGYDCPTGAISVGNKIQIAVDVDAGKLWIGKENTWYLSGNPSTGANPIATFTPNSSVYFAFSIYTGQGTANFGASAWTYTPPTGFLGMSSSSTGSTATSWMLNNGTSGVLSNNDSIFADGIVRTIGSVSQTGPTTTTTSVSNTGSSTAYGVALVMVGGGSKLPNGSTVTSIGVARPGSSTQTGSIYIVQMSADRNTITVMVKQSITFAADSSFVYATLGTPYVVPSTGDFFVGCWNPGSTNGFSPVTGGNWNINGSDLSVGVPTSGTSTLAHGFAFGYSTSAYTYTCTSITPTPSIIPSIVSKLIPQTYLAQGLSGETLCKDFPLTLGSYGSSGELVPTLSGYTSGAITISASDYSSGGYLPWYAFNGDGVTNNWASTAGSTKWLQVDFGSTTNIGSYSITTYNNGLTAWTLQGSATGSFSGEQTVIDNQSAQQFPGNTIRTFTLSSTASFRYYRLVCTAIGAGGYYYVGELQFYGVTQSTTTSQLVTSQAYSLLPYIGSSALNKSINITVGGTTSSVIPSGTVTESQGAVLFKSNQNTQNNYTGVSNSSNTKCGQAVIVSSSCVVTTLGLYLQKFASPTGNAYLRIYGCSGTPGSSGSVTGSYLATSAAIDVSTLSSSWSWVEMPLTTPYSMTAGNYCIVLEYNDGTTTSNGVYVGFSGSGSDDTGNLLYQNGNAYTSGDALYRIYTAGSYNTIIPITTVASTPTAASIKSKYSTPTTISSVSYVNSTPEVKIVCNPVTVTNNTALKKLALRLRSDFGKAKTISIVTTQTGS